MVTISKFQFEYYVFAELRAYKSKEQHPQIIG